MPIFESNGKKYNVQDVHIENFKAEHPDATTVLEREGQKFRVKVGDYGKFVQGVPAAPAAPRAEKVKPAVPETEADKSSFTFTDEELGLDEKKSRIRQKWEAQKAERNKEQKTNDSNEPLTTFGEGMRQGAESLYEGGRYAAGEIGRIYGDSQRTYTDALEYLEKQGDDFDASSFNKSQAIEDERNERFQLAMEEYRKEMAKRRKERKNLGFFATIVHKWNDPEKPDSRDYIGSHYEDMRAGKAITALDEALKEAGGDVDKAREILEKKSKEEGWGDRVTREAGEALSRMRPVEGAAWWGQLVPQVTGQAAAIGANFIPYIGGPLSRVLAYGSTAGLTASSAGSAMHEARLAGATDEEIMSAGTWQAGIEYFSEKIPLERLLGSTGGAIFRKGFKRSGGNIAIDELERALNEGNKRLGGKLFSGQTAKEFVKNVGVEAASEFIAEGAGTFVPIIYEDKENYPTLGEAFENAIEGAKAGAVMGGFLGGGTQVITNRANNARRKKQGSVILAETKDGVVEILQANGDVTEILTSGGETLWVPSNDIIKKHAYSYDEWKNNEVYVNIETAYQEGYEAADEQKSAVKQAYDMERERALSTFGEEVVQQLDDDPISTLAAMTEVDRAEAIDYVNAKTAYEGMIDRINADIDERIAASDKEIDSHKNKQDGAIHPAMMRGINGAAPKRVYIVNGNVATFEDGTIDTANSSSMIIVRDAETGEVSAASADDLESLDAVIDTEAEKKTVAEQIANEYAAQKAAVIENGMVNGENGELTYNSNDGVHTVEILGENGDVFTILDNGVERIATREWVDELKAQNGVVSPVEVKAEEGENVVEAPKTALERVPKAENGEPVYEQADAETAWDAIMEQANDEELATQVVEGMIADKEAALKKLENSKVREGVTVAEKIAAAQQRKAAIEQAKADLAKWEEIAGVKAKRAETAAVESAPVEEQTAPVVEQVAPVAEETQPTGEEQPIEQVAEVAPVQEESGSLEIPNSSTVSQASEQVIDHYTLNSAGNSTQMLKDMEAVRKSNREEYGKITPAYELFYKAKERGLYPNELEELRAIVKGTSLEGKVDGWFTPVMAEGGNAPDNGSVLLSDEVDENGRQFVLNSKGEIAFGEIAEDTGLTPAPILLSEGLITNPATNDGYGLVHIEARHGDQIRNAGYNSVVEFVEEVAKNYEVIREGKDRDGHQTYMLQLTDKHNNTLMVELSGDGTYWNINTAGIFKTSYGKNRKEVYNRHTTAKQSTETVEASQDTEQSGTQATSSMNAPTTSSASEDTTQSANEQENTQKSGETAENGGENAVPEWLNKVPDDGRNFFVYVKFAGENKYQAIDLGKGETVDRLVRATMLQKEQLQALVDKLPSVLLEDAEFQIRDAKGNIYYNSGKVAAGNEVAKQEDKEVAVATEDELDIYLAEMKAAQEIQKAFAQKTPLPSFFVKAYTENDAEVIKKLDKQFNDVLQTLVPMDIPAIEATIKGMKERKRLIKDNENPNYKAFDHIEKALAKRKKQLEKELTEDDKRRLDIIKRGNRGELKETPQPKQENKPVESEPIRAEAPVTSETTESESKQETEEGDVVLYRGDEDVPRLNKHKVEKIFGGIWIEDKEEFAKFVSAVNNYAFEENGQGIAYTDSNFYAYYLNIDGQVIPYASVKLTAEQSQEVVNQVNQEIENVREGERVKKYIDTGLERAWSIQDKDNAQPLNNSGASNRRRNGGVVSDLLRKGRYFDNPGLYVKTQRADRFGFLTPSQIERTGNGEVANSARQRRRMAEKARQVAEKLNLDNVEVLESTEGLTGKKATSKGWFDPRTGKITVVVPNHGSTGDIVETVLHEAVAHYGLRKLFGENFKNFLDNVYRNVTPEIRAEITELAKKHGWDFHTATEEYLASLAENTNFEKVNPSLWSNIKSFFMKMLAKVGITLDEPLGDNELRYILWRSHQNLVNPGWFNVFGQAEDIAKQYELGVGNYASGEVKTESGEVAAEDDSALLHREGGAPGSAQAADEPMSFDEIKTAPLTFEEKITQGVLTASALNKKNLDLRQQALREFGRDLTRLLTLMKEQRAYDKSTVDLLVKLSRLYFENAQVLDKMSAYNVKRIMGVLNNAIGKRNITDDANRLLGILMDAHTKELNNLLDTFVKTRATKMNTAGVEIIGSLDKHGQMVLATYKAAVEYDANKIDAELLKAENELTDESKVVREEAAARLEGLLLAKEYKDEIKSRREEIAELEKEIKDKARQAREGTLDRSAYREFKRATQEAITKSNLELIGAYHALIQKMSTGIGAASARAREFMKKQLERVQEIQHDANSDMEGKSADTQGEIPDNWNNSIARIVMGPMVTFQGILKKLGEKSVDGKGYLYNRFMKQITNAGHRLWKKKVGNLLSLNGKLSEIFGREMQYNDLYAIDKKGKGMTITYVENGGPKEIELSQGQMMYLYMINKMSDGAMKLRGMGITESAVLQIEGALMPELKTFADWVQATFLNEKRAEYNEVHERMFGSAMANIEDYFPIKINTKSLTKEEDVALKNVEDKPSTVTGSIIKRTRNAAPVDLSANAIDVLMEHLDKMEQWAAFAETNRDLNSLLSYKRFRNQVLNMKTRRFGSGKKLWDNFRDVCALASRNYTPKTSDVDRAVTNITKGVTAAKISFRLFTAMKQLLSAPAFYTETDVKGLYKAYKSPKESWDWAIENLPGFAERWQSRQSGNERLKTTDADWDIWKNKYIKGAQRAGMLPNAWVDAVVVSTGARAVYLTKLKQFKAAGYEADVAEAKALQAAAEAYNESQQSSEGAYLSAMQADRTVISTILTVFKNSNFGYTRKTAQSVANLAKHLKKGNKAQSIEFMAKQMMREGLTEEQARKYADKLWKESILRDSADVAMFGFLLNALWALGPELIYLFGGDDEEEKEKSWANVVMEGLLSPVAGLGGGDFISDVVTAAIDGNWKNIELPGLPAFGDMENIYSLMEYDPVRGATELLNMLVSAGVGVNPKTFTDMYAAIASTDFTNPEELGLFALKFVNAPQGQIDRLMVDKALENGGDNLAAVTAEYMEYKKRYNTPLLGGLYSDEGERKAYERYAKRFKRQVNDRLGNVAEDDTAFAMYYEDASPELRSLLTGLREKYIEGDKEPLEPKAVADIAFETLYGKKELNTEYLKLATPDDVDALIELKQKRSELRKFKEALDALPPEQTGEFYDANADALGKYDYLDKALRKISELQKAMTLNKEAGQEILDGIRSVTDAVSAEITSTENN